MKGQSLSELLITILAHARGATTLDEFLDHPIIYLDKEKVYATLNTLVLQGIFQEDISTYPPQDGKTVYMFADNKASQRAFKKAIAEG